MQFSYAVQHKPKGLTEALTIAEPFLDGAPSALILGDNIMAIISHTYCNKPRNKKWGNNFTSHVDPHRFGIADFNASGKVIHLEEKPIKPRSSYAVTGLYFYDESAPEKARKLTPSARGELEITDLNHLYLEGTLYNQFLGRGFAWLDTGTQESLLQASMFT